MEKPIPEEVQWIIVRLSADMSQEDVAMYTDVSQGQVNEVMATFMKYGTVKAYPLQQHHMYPRFFVGGIQASRCYPCAQRQVSS